MNVPYKLLIVSDDSFQAEDLQAKVNTIIPQNQVLESKEVRREIARIKPDIVLLHESKESSQVQMLPYIAKEAADALVIFITERRDPVRTRDVNRSGAFDILFIPEEIHALEDVLSRAVKALQVKRAENESAASFSWAKGQVVAMYSGKGGSGRSLIASTLAQTIGLDTSSSVLLVDLNLQYGGVETLLKTDNQRTLYDLTPVLNELNDNHIRSVTMVEKFSQIEVLPSPVDAELAEQITEEHVERLLRTARLYYDYIIVDLPTEMNPLTYSVLEEADHIGYVMVPDVLAMRVFASVLDLFAKLGVDPLGRLGIILNRTNRDTELTEKDLSRHFQYPVIGELREDHKKVQQLVNQGSPMRTTRRERGLPGFARDIQKLAKWLLTNQSSESA
ncbi:AAA family ATPase [Mechercharimyces sp. CAU 1602]|uniref:AAA family ATPase n=1 Tax=Mechercharimyces sp. CAU 1602 TaxID=2973933 RepID=UPI002162B741|nr:AAA family ATPase [Mechercharimyces sp. CAU 1602]MCS1352429.1 AAA family ATPase [Mechercharimyces sp. CAU 1602]